MTMMKPLLIASLFLAACGGGKSDKPAPAPASGTTPAPAVPTGPAAPAWAATAAANAKFSKPAAAIAAGRKLTKEGKLAEAKVAFENALALNPDDAVALSELGYVELKLGNDDAALAATDRSIVAATEPKIRAASLYNKGRLLEKKGDLEGAKAAYTESLSLRPNDTVQKRLDQLGGAAATLPAELGAAQLTRAYKKVRDVPWETTVHGCGAGCKATVLKVVYGDVDGDANDEALVVLEGPFDAPSDHNGHLYGVRDGKVVHLGRARSGGNEHPEYAPRFVDAKLGAGAARVTWTWQLWGNCDDEPDLCKETVVETYKLVDGKATFEGGEPVD